MPDETPKPTPQQESRAEAKAKLIAAQAERRTTIAKLAANAGKEFAAKDVDQPGGRIISFIPDQNIMGKPADAYVINLGHPNADHIVAVEDFNNQFTIK